MLTEETKKWIERGIEEEENSENGYVLHTWPPYETKVFYEFYNMRKKHTEVEDKVLENLAKSWELYFELGKDGYKECMKEYYREKYNIGVL